MTKIPMTKTQSPLTILPPLTSPFKGEEFYRIKVLNLDIGICLGFSASSLGFNLRIAELVPRVKRGISLRDCFVATAPHNNIRGMCLAMTEEGRHYRLSVIVIASRRRGNPGPPLLSLRAKGVAIPALLYCHCERSVAIPALLYCHCERSVAIPALLYCHCERSVAISAKPNSKYWIRNTKQYQMTKIPMTKTVLNLDIRICSGFSASSLGFPGDNRRGALSPPSYLLTRIYTLRVRKISTRITSHTAAPRAIITHNHGAIAGAGGTTPFLPVVKVPVASPNTVVSFIASTVQ